jgi:hypothetical protein
MIGVFQSERESYALLGRGYNDSVVRFFFRKWDKKKSCFEVCHLLLMAYYTTIIGESCKPEDGTIMGDVNAFTL